MHRTLSSVNNNRIQSAVSSDDDCDDVNSILIAIREGEKEN